MSLAYIRRTYGVPAKRGGRVRFSGGARPRLGTITGAAGTYLLIRLDGDNFSRRHHPTWELTYLPNGSPREERRAESEGGEP